MGSGGVTGGRFCAEAEADHNTNAIVNADMLEPADFFQIVSIVSRTVIRKDSSYRF
jgi:hypothetical protein